MSPYNLCFIFSCVGKRMTKINTRHNLWTNQSNQTSINHGKTHHLKAGQGCFLQLITTPSRLLRHCEQPEASSLSAACNVTAESTRSLIIWTRGRCEMYSTAGDAFGSSHLYYNNYSRLVRNMFWNDSQSSCVLNVLRAINAWKHDIEGIFESSQTR